MLMKGKATFEVTLRLTQALLKRLSAPALVPIPIAIAPKNSAPAHDTTVAATIRRILLIEGAQGIHDIVEPDRAPPFRRRTTESRC